MVGVLVFGVGNRTVIVDGYLVAMAIKNMAVDAVEACRDLAIREPLPVVVSDAARQLPLAAAKDCRRVFVPVQMLCLVCPEVFRVLQAVSQDLVLDVFVLLGHGAGLWWDLGRGAERWIRLWGVILVVARCRWPVTRPLGLGLRSALFLWFRKNASGVFKSCSR